MKNKPLTAAQKQMLGTLADHAPAWVETPRNKPLENLGYIKVRKTADGKWEARITQQGLEEIGTLGD